MADTTCGHCGLPINLANRKRHTDCFPQHRDPALIATDPNRCTIADSGERCPRDVKAKHWCNTHLQRYGRYGDPTIRPGRRSPGELLALVLMAARATTDECVMAPCEKGRATARYKGEPMPATRAVWAYATGEDPGDAWVLHTCHRGDDGCINIRHLYLGDHAQNTQDMVGADRQARGVDNSKAKLTDAEVIEIRRLYAAGGVSQRALAVQFGVRQGTINQVVTRKTWRHVE